MHVFIIRFRGQRVQETGVKQSLSVSQDTYMEISHHIALDPIHNEIECIDKHQRFAQVAKHLDGPSLRTDASK